MKQSEAAFARYMQAQLRLHAVRPLDGLALEELADTFALTPIPAVPFEAWCARRGISFEDEIAQLNENGIAAIKADAPWVTEIPNGR